MSMTYNPKRDTLYIRREGPHQVRSIEDFPERGIVLEYDEKESLVGISILKASSNIDKGLLKKIKQ